MTVIHRPICTLCIATLLAARVYAGPFLDNGISAEDARLSSWATAVVDYSPASGTSANATSSHAINRADGLTVSLGDRDQAELLQGLSSGTITVSFSTPFGNGPGWDLAIFENAFSIVGDGNVFAELAYVEVSSNGDSFVRFPPTSLTQKRIDYGFGSAFSAIDPSDVHNLAGKHQALMGTPFDLSNLRTLDLVQNGEVNLSNIHYVRIVDIPGGPSFANTLIDKTGQVAFPDVLGNPILDPWNTSATGTAGFDLDAVGARWPAALLTEVQIAGDPAELNQIPEPTLPYLWLLISASGIGIHRRHAKRR